METFLSTTRSRVAAGALFTTLGIGLSFGLLPALADEDHPTTDVEAPGSRLAEDGSIIPEPDPEPESKDAIESRAELAELEKAVDPVGSPAVYVCANEGAYEYRVVQGHEAPEDAKVNEDAGPVNELPDPCAGFDWVVGK